MRSITAMASLWLLALCVALPAHGQTSGGSGSLQLAERELSRELEQMPAMLDGDRQTLLEASTLLPATSISSKVLEDARLDLAGLLSRQSGLQTRLKARRGAIAVLSSSEESVQQQLQDSEISDQERQSLEAELAAIEAEKAQLRDIENKLEKLSRYINVRVNLSRQRLNALQSRFELPDLNQMRKNNSPEAKALRQAVDERLRNASTIRGQLMSLGNGADALSQRRQLELSALAEEEQAEFAQMSLERLQAERLLTALNSLSGSRSTPPRVIEKAMQNLQRLGDELQGQGAIIMSKRQQFESQLAILQQQAALGGNQSNSSFATLQSLLDEVNKQDAALAALQDKLLQLYQQYEVDLAASSQSALFERAELPADSIGWKQLGGNLLTLPIRILDAFKHAIVNLGRALGDAEPGILGLCIVGVGALLALAKFLRRRLAAATTGSALDIVQTHIWALVPPLSLLGVGLAVGLRDRDLLLLITPLSIYPAVRLTLDFANNFLDVYTPELDKAKTQLLLRETRGVVMLVAVLAAVLVCAQVVALSPAVVGVIDRVAMLCLLLVSLPLLHLRGLMMEGVEGEVQSRLIRGITLLLPLLLALCAVAGVIGYVNLAQAISSRLGYLGLFAIGLHYSHAILMELSSRLHSRMAAADEDAANFWRTYLVDPLRRVAMVLLVIGAGTLLFSLYGWNAQTPVVRFFPIVLNATVFSVGESPIYLKTLLIGVLVILAAIWGGGWSKQVSYRWVYQRVDDQGLRNSLATFTQYFVVVLGVVVALKVIGLDLTALTVFAGALGVGIGFGMQQIVVNFISGILLLVERPLSTTDQVAVDKFEGEVTRIGIRSLTVKTWDSQEVIIPNSAVITRPFTNFTRSDDLARTVLMIGISYDDDPKQAIDILKNIIAEHPAILDAPAPKVLLWEYADSALMLRIQFHSRIRGDVGRGDLRSQLLLSIWDAFKTAGITIPFPQRDLHVYSHGGAKALASPPPEE